VKEFYEDFIRPQDFQIEGCRNLQRRDSKTSEVPGASIAGLNANATLHGSSRVEQRPDPEIKDSHICSGLLICVVAHRQM
jgi:hypothetical protein